MVGDTRSKEEILAVMRRLGMTDRISQAQEILPDVVHLDRDAATLRRLGLDLDVIVDRLGSSPW